MPGLANLWIMEIKIRQLYGATGIFGAWLMHFRSTFLTCSMEPYLSCMMYGRNPLTTGVKQAVPYRTGREARYLSVSTE